MRIAEVDPEAGQRLDLLVQGEFATLVPREGLAQLRGDVRSLGDQRVADMRSFPALWQMEEPDVTGGAFHESTDR